MTRPIAVAFALLLVSGSAVCAEEADDAAWADRLRALRVRGRVKEEFAYRLHDPGDASKLRTLGWLDGKLTLTDWANLRLEGRAWWDGVFAVTDRYPENVRRDQETDADLRQALLSLSFGALDLRLGRQQIVWGEAISTFVADVVNPKDFREFILPEYSEIRIPLWALDTTYHLAEGVALEGVWTPDTRFNKIGKAGSEFQFRGPAYRIRSPVVRVPDDPDEFSLARSAGGARLSYLVSGWDVTLLYYDGEDKTAVLYQRRQAAAPGPDTIVLEPHHPRLHIVGATVAKSIEPVVIRAEAVYSIGKRYETTDPLDPNGIVRRDTLDYLVGVDWTVLGVDTALQFMQKVLTGAATNLTRGGVEAQVTSSFALRLTTGFFDNTLTPTVLGLVNANRGDHRLSARLDYQLTGAVTVSAGVDFFGGPRDTLYGQFTDNDRAYVEMSWKF